jgi:predicted Zn finger-like uncharacterized protein
MSFSLSCSSCQTSLRVRDELAGRKVKCPKCATIIAVPKAEAPLTDDDEEEKPRTKKRADLNEEEDRPRRKKKKQRKKNSGVLLYGLVGGGAALAIVIVIGILLLNRGANRPTAGGAPPRAKGGAPEAGPAAFLDQTKTIPSQLEWNREVTSRLGGTMTFRITSQGPFSVLVITERAYNALKAGKKGGNKEDLLFDRTTTEPQMEGSITLPPGSSWFIIENQSNSPAEMRLQCFAKD